MTVNRRAILGMEKLGIDGVINEATSIQNSLSQPEFSAVLPAPPEVLAIIAVLIPLQDQCRKRNFENKVARDNALQALFAALLKQCNSVNGLAQGDTAYITRAGFKLSKIREHSPVPAEGLIKELKPLKDGQAIVIFKGIKYRDFYEVLVTGPNGYSKLETVVHPKAKLTDLPLNVELQVVVRGVNGKGDGEWSSPVSFIASRVVNLDNDTTPTES